ncbi:MAG: hypothetical protein HC933_08495 [Pleurocapsa sp. SU_196_0]|nr:hypothetical protein [Pleurocapsa sp. SU_196_0]
MNPLPSLTPPRSEPPVTPAAPHWSERNPDRIAYCAWVLEHQPRVTYRFFALANGFVQRNPSKRLSAEATVCVMRFYGSNTNGDEFEVNSNIKKLAGTPVQTRSPGREYRTAPLLVGHADSAGTRDVVHRVHSRTREVVRRGCIVTAALELGATPGARGCGESRTANSIYLECGMSAAGAPLESFLVDPPRIVDAQELGLNPRGVRLVEIGGTWHILDWVGSKHYPFITDFLEETRRLGVSRKVSDQLDFSKLTTSSRLLMIHAHGAVTNGADLEPFLTHFACPTGRGHTPTDGCIGLHWHLAPPTTQDSLGSRREIPSGSYPVKPLLEGAVTPEYALAVFASFPITRIALTANVDGQWDASKLSKISEARGIPQEVVKE